MKKIVLGCCIVFSFFSCKEPKSTGSSSVPKEPASDTIAQPAPADTLMRFIASFYSIGEGIDRGQPEKLRAFVQDFGKKINHEITFSESHWGREGETDFCFPLAELTDDQQGTFINGAKEALSASKHVYFFENKACKKGR